MPKRLIFVVFLIKVIMILCSYDCMGSTHTILDDNIILTDSLESKTKLEQMLKKAKLSNFKIIVVKEGDPYFKPRKMKEIERISGYYLLGKIGDDLKIQMNLNFLIPDYKHFSLEEVLSEHSLSEDVLKKGYILLEGEYFYEKYGGKIKLSGYIRDDKTVKITEYLYQNKSETKKNILGYFYGKFNEDFTVLSGEWKSAKRNRKYEFTLKRVATYYLAIRQYKINRIIGDFIIDYRLNHCENNSKCLEEELKNFKYNYVDAKYNYIQFDDKRLANLTRMFVNQKNEMLSSADELAQTEDCIHNEFVCLFVNDSEIFFYSPNLVVLSELSEYSYGGYLGYSFKKSIIYKLNNMTAQFEKVELFDLINKSNQCINKLANLIDDAISKGEDADLKIAGFDAIKTYIKDSSLAYLPDTTGINFVFSPYFVAARAAGFVEVKINYATLMKIGCISKNSILMDFIDKKY